MTLPTRKAIRLKNYNYSQAGAYFITICTKEKRKILGNINVGFGVCDEPRVQLTPYGSIADKYIKLMACKYENVSIDKYVIMPNHIHFIIVVNDTGGLSQAPNPTNEVIPKFISLFKRYCNREYGENIWQKSYNDHIIRGENDFLKIWEYIENNPIKWQDDLYFTE